jgi:hypothetical protein
MGNYTKKDLIEFGNFMLSKERNKRITENLKGTHTGIAMSKHTSSVTVADLEHFKHIRNGGKEGNV